MLMALVLRLMGGGSGGRGDCKCGEGWRAGIGEIGR
jgi:hypothetical protein